MTYIAPYATPPDTQFIDAWIEAGKRDQLAKLLQQGEANAAAADGVTAEVAAEATAGGVTELGADTAIAATLPEDGMALIVLGTAYGVSTQIRRIPGWDNLFKHLGEDLADTFYGGSQESGLNSTQKLWVADYVQHRFIAQRQREAAQNATFAGAITRIAQREQSLARDISKVNQGAHNADKAVIAHADRAAADAKAAAVAYANARAHNVGVAAEQYAQRVGAANRTYAHNVAAQAQANAQRYTHDEIHSLEAQLPHLIAPAVAVAIATHLKPITEALSALRSQVDKLQTENDECTEPMCETVGPKSDWGKLLKRFAPKAIFALLAVLAAENPDEVAKVSAELGSALGPVLEAAMAAALIPLSDSPIGQPSEVGGALGGFPL